MKLEWLVLGIVIVNEAIAKELKRCIDAPKYEREFASLCTKK